LTMVIAAWLAGGCVTTTQQREAMAVGGVAGDYSEDHEAIDDASGMLILPELEAAELGGKPLKAVATTTIIGDVVAQVGGNTIELTTLIAAGQDSHSYEPATQDLTAVAEADVIFVNGWNLEERLIDNLESIREDAPLVPVSANIIPLELGEHAHEEEVGHEEEAGEEHSHGAADPHAWFSIKNVKQWVENIEHMLTALDPANAALYQSNAGAYLDQLAELERYTETKLADIPAGNRVLVTNHDSLGYFAREYNFEVLGTVIPGVSTLAEPSASDLAELIETMREHGVCTIFTETSVSDNLAQTVAAELKNCERVQVLSLYTESVGPAGSGADSYIGMFRSNVDTIMQGLN